ncbi:unnamed protein product, partial [Meganyctiphanes norvegica]
MAIIWMSDEESSNNESNEQWYLDKRFSHFWQSYSQIMLRTHHSAIARATQTYMRVGASLSNMMVPNPTMPGVTAWPSSSNFYKHSGKTPWTTSSIKSETSSIKLSRTQRINRKKSRKRRLRRKLQQMQENFASDSEMLQQMSEGMHINDSDDGDVEIHEDYLAFLLKTEQHKSEWQKVKESKNKQTSVLPTVEESQNKEHPDLVRSREMHQLYGDASPRIHAMETAIQLSYDRISTVNHPGFWPSVPLNWNA